MDWWEHTQGEIFHITCSSHRFGHLNFSISLNTDVFPPMTRDSAFKMLCPVAPPKPSTYLTLENFAIRRRQIPSLFRAFGGPLFAGYCRSDRQDPNVCRKHMSSRFQGWFPRWTQHWASKDSIKLLELVRNWSLYALSSPFKVNRLNCPVKDFFLYHSPFEHLQLFFLLGISYMSCSFASFFSVHMCTLHVCLFFLGFVLSNLVLAIQLFHNFSSRAKRADGACRRVEHVNLSSSFDSDGFWAFYRVFFWLSEPRLCSRTPELWLGGTMVSLPECCVFVMGARKRRNRHTSSFVLLLQEETMKGLEG